MHSPIRDSDWNLEAIKVVIPEIDQKSLKPAKADILGRA